MNFNEQIDLIVDKFDFQSVVAYYEVMQKPPFKRDTPHNMGTSEQIKKLATQMLKDVSQLDDDTVVEKYGLEAERIQNHLELRFVPLRTNTLSVMHD